MTNHLTRRGFLRQSASAGALGLVGGRVSAASIGQTTAAGKLPPADEAQVPPAYRGFLKKNLHDLPTPALLIDLDVFEKNIQTMANYLTAKKTTLRRPGKAHRS